MKILELRFKNLNALMGEWFIDFSRPDYQAEGLFGIFGPTGSGKTTILDAICLALYGATPRLGRITKNSNEILSRPAAECYAEVLFQIGARRFRSHWEQRRSRRSLEGKLQEPEHQLFDADTGQPIETQKRLVLQAIEETTGMDFDRFTRSMLLAQGAFDRFLRADLETKSKILEQITGTEIYSHISQAVYVRCQAEREQLKQLLAQSAALGNITEQDPAELQAQIAAVQQQLAEQTAALHQWQQAYAWLQRIQEWERVLALSAEQYQAAKQALADGQPDYERWQLAERAAPVEPVFLQSQHLQAQWTSEQQRLEQVLAQKPTLQAAYTHWQSVVQQQELAVQQAWQVVQDYQPVVQAYQVMQTKIAGHEERIRQLQAERQTIVQTLQSGAQAQERIEHTLQQFTQQAEKTEAYLQQHAADARLLEVSVALEGQLLQSQAYAAKHAQGQQSILQLQALQRTQAESTQQALQAKEKMQQVSEQAQQKIQQAEQALQHHLAGRLLREIQAEKTLLEQQARLEFKIEQLEHERAQLQAGEPCPLCGALEHPYQEATPQRSATEAQIAYLAQQLQDVAQAQQSVQAAQQALIACQLQQTQAQSRYDACLQEQYHSQERLAELTLAQKQLAVEQQQVYEKIHSYLHGIDLPVQWQPGDSVTTLLQAVQARQKAWKDALQQQQTLQEQRQQVFLEQQRLREKQQGILAQIQQLEGLLQQEQQPYAHWQSAKIQQFGTDHPPSIAQQHTQIHSTAQQALETARIEWQTIQSQAHRLEEAEKSSLERLAIHAAEKQAQAVRLEHVLRTQNFTSVEQFLAARAHPEQRQQWLLEHRQREQQYTAAQAQHQERTHQWQVEKQKNLTQVSLQEAQQAMTQAEQNVQQTQAVLTTAEAQYQHFQQQQAQYQALQADLEQQRLQLQPWEQLNTYIGAADGKKYRSFAQSITFQSVLVHANQQLSQMTDRYILLRDPEAPLSIQVIDQYQAGMKRTTSNLSGGETFMVSLCLALGLAKMSSQSVQVESLFLDEGFGTLDEETLDAALEVLTQLQASGMLIGVISHMPALKERIRSQILVQPILAGKSRLQGPGCQQLSEA